MNIFKDAIDEDYCGIFLSTMKDNTDVSGARTVAKSQDGFYIIVREKNGLIYANFMFQSCDLDKIIVYIGQVSGLLIDKTIIVENKMWTKTDDRNLKLHKALIYNGFRFEGVLRHFNNNEKSVRYIYG